MKESYYVTFGQKSPFRNGYVVVVASGLEEAQAEAHQVFGNHFSNVYTRDTMNFEYYPAGQLGLTIEGL